MKIVLRSVLIICLLGDETDVRNYSAFCVIISEESRHIFLDAEAKVILDDGGGVSMERLCLCLLSPLFLVMGRWYVNKHMHAPV